MPQVTIKSGDTLSKIAAQYGTTAADIIAANKGNAAVKSADLIIAGGNINIPDKIGAPAAGPSTSAPGTLDPAAVQNPQAQTVGDLGNLRMALREALNEAARKRVATNFKQLGGLATGAAPGTIGSVVDLIRGNIKPTVEQTFSDIVTSYKDATEAKQKELDRINELRLEFGSLVPSSVTDLDTALDLVAPAIDKERRMKLEKMRNDQAVDNDIESWAESLARGEISIGNVPAGIRTQVKVRSDAIRDTLEGEAKEEYKSRIGFRVERKVSDWETERNLVLQDDNLNVAEQREMIDYIDGLEAEAKASKASGKKNSSWFGPNPGFRNETSAPVGPTMPQPQGGAGITYDPSQAFKPFDDAFVAPFRNLYTQPPK